MSRRARFVLMGAMPLFAALAFVACSDDGAGGFDATPDAPDATANLPDAAPPVEEDAAVVDARTPFDASDELVTCAQTPCATQLVGRGSHFCALLSDKTVVCWGSAYRAFGALDGGAGSSSNIPRATSMGLSGVEQLSSANSTTCARLATGSVICWGDNTSNSLGLSPPGADYVGHDPALVSLDGGALGNVAHIDVGFLGAVFTVMKSGELWSWGVNGNDVLGRTNEPGDYLGPGPATDLAALQLVRAVGVSYPGYPGFGMGVAKNGQLYSWGRSKRLAAYPSPIPLAVAGLANVSSMETVLLNACVVADGRLYCWGEDGLLACSGTTDAATSPLAIRTRGEARAQQVSMNYGNTCVRLADGSIECCGVDESGQLGRGLTDAGTTRARVLEKAEAFTGHAVHVTVGLTTTCALVQGGTVQCWGGNQYGELGQGTVDNGPHPIPVTVKLD